MLLNAVWMLHATIVIRERAVSIAISIELNEINEIDLNVISESTAAWVPSMRVAIRLNFNDATLIKVRLLALPRAAKGRATLLRVAKVVRHAEQLPHLAMHVAA